LAKSSTCKNSLLGVPVPHKVTEGALVLLASTNLRINAGKTWLHELNRKVNGGNDVQVELMSGALILEKIAKKS
jgi:hypothetical protein